MIEYPIKSIGLLCKGQMVLIGWPEENEYDLITNLRNRAHVKKWFLDDRMIDLMQNRKWLETGMDRPKEALLSIRDIKHKIFLGTIGWSDWNLVESSACFGRLIVDDTRVRQLSHEFPLSYRGVAYDACLTLRNYAFNNMKLLIGETFVFENNILALKINKSIGLNYQAIQTRLRPDGTKINTIKMRITRGEWLEQIKAD